MFVDRTRRVRALLTMLLCTAAPCALWAQNTTKPSAAEAAVRQASSEYLDALARGDAKALAEHWTAEGTYVDPDGEIFAARDLVADIAATPPAPRPTAKLSDVTVRFLSPDVAVQEGQSEFALRDGTPARGRFHAVWVRQNGRWRLDRLEDHRAAMPSHASRLAVLEPFVGEWSGEVNGRSVRMTTRWNAAKTFLRQDVAIAAAGREVSGSVQVIGWDPREEQIRSWAFYDDGGHGQGLWSQEAHVWMVLVENVRADGTAANATHVYRFVDKNTLVCQSIHGSAGGEALPDVEVTLKRQAASK
ncbi:MAG: nuclear transport factor 2 family protein [Pirellulales bacterium]|nr:nuclear transport factor 2 family protein [Pirellulales bacterium]